MGAVDHEAARAIASCQEAWETLDDASQLLVRAEAMVMLLRCADDVEEHHRYGAEFASDLLQAIKAKLSDAQARICPPVRRDQRSA